jgi:predicted 2-oxoglutarate/Fe(II)-dependent dioxygenase YbiX
VADVPFARERCEGKWAVTVANVLSRDECARLMAAAEAQGYAAATVGDAAAGGVSVRTAVRDGEQCDVCLPAVADAIWPRLKHALPRLSTWGSHRYAGLNERLRFLRYSAPGQQFRPHLDEPYVRPDGPRVGDFTRYTVLLYLNDAASAVRYTGCETTFYAMDDAGRPGDAHHVPPVAGSALVFEHDLLHAATPLVDGCKCAIRTDVFVRVV